MYYRKIKKAIMGKKYTLLVADTQPKQLAGMRIFDEVPYRTGMIFTYNSPVLRSFTMEGVKFPLRIFFFDVQNKLIDSFTCLPGQTNIKPSRPFSYVIEIPK